jgi:hypothetical protein
MTLDGSRMSSALTLTYLTKRLKRSNGGSGNAGRLVDWWWEAVIDALLTSSQVLLAVGTFTNQPSSDDWMPVFEVTWVWLFSKLGRVAARCNSKGEGCWYGSERKVEFHNLQLTHYSLHELLATCCTPGPPFDFAIWQGVLTVKYFVKLPTDNRQSSLSRSRAW